MPDGERIGDIKEATILGRKKSLNSTGEEAQASSIKRSINLVTTLRKRKDINS